MKKSITNEIGLEVVLAAVRHSLPKMKVETGLVFFWIELGESKIQEVA